MGKRENIDKTILESNKDDKTVLESPEEDKTRLIEDDKTMLVGESQEIELKGKPLYFAWLVGIDGPHKGIDIRIIKEKTMIGKASTNDIIIPDPYISSVHAAIYFEKDKFVVDDLKSSNGTYLNEKRIEREVLKDNDIIKFGKLNYKFKCIRKVAK